MSNSNPTDVSGLASLLYKLHSAILRYRSYNYCLGLWSEFVRERDARKCIVCGESQNLVAHHIARKVTYPISCFQTGNGITLCRSCHKEPHAGFNRCPDLSLLFDFQNGEKIELMMAYYGILMLDAQRSGQLSDDYYYLSDGLLRSFKSMQGFDHSHEFPGTRLEQAYLIWRQCPKQLRDALFQANGIKIPDDFIQTGEISVFTWAE